MVLIFGVFPSFSNFKLCFNSDSGQMVIWPLALTRDSSFASSFWVYRIKVFYTLIH
jgi:hypothetical protein